MSDDMKSHSSEFPPIDRAAWRRKVESELAGTDFEKALVSHLLGGLEISPLYDADDLPDGHERGGLPGFTPYLRGRRTLGGRGASWLPAQEFAHPGPGAAARAAADGARLLWLVPDAASRLGLRPGRASEDLPGGPLSGAPGLPLSSAELLESLLEGVDLEDVAVVIEAGGGALPLAALLVAHARRQGVSPEKLRGGFGCDPLAALAADGRLSGSLDDAFDEAAELAAWSAENAPGLRALLVSTVPHHEAGASAEAELAFAAAGGVETLRRLTGRGLDLETVCGQVRFAFAMGRDLFTGIAKLRAARLVWAKAVAACGGSAEARSAAIHARTSAAEATGRDPWGNLLRATVESFAAIVGGASSVATAPFDETLGVPAKSSRRLALNLQHVLAEEGHLGRVLDPAGGSYYLESLSDRLARRAWKLFQEIEAEGGLAACLESGWVRERLSRAAEERRRAVAKRKEAIVGVSEFPNLGEELPERAAAEGPREDPLAGAGARWASSALAVAEGGRFEAAVQAAEAGATTGQIAELLGRSEPAAAPALERRRWAGPFETLRAASDRRLEETGSRPRVFLASYGRPADYRARAGFAANFFAAGGIEPIDAGGFGDSTAAAEAFAESGAELAVICSSDELYPEAAPALARALEGRGARRVLLAGRPGEHEELYRGAGVDTFIYLGCDTLAILEELLHELEVLA